MILRSGFRSGKTLPTPPGALVVRPSDPMPIGLPARPATYGTGPEEECVACGLRTTRWIHGVTSYPICPLCAVVAQREGR